MDQIKNAETYEEWNNVISFVAMINGKLVVVELKSDDLMALEELMDIFEDLCVFDEVI